MRWSTTICLLAGFAFKGLAAELVWNIEEDFGASKLNTRLTVVEAIDVIHVIVVI